MWDGATVKRLLRILRAGLFTGSLLLFLAVMTLWIRSYWFVDSAGCIGPLPDGRGRSISVSTIRGVVWIERTTSVGSIDEPTEWRRGSEDVRSFSRYPGAWGF